MHFRSEIKDLFVFRVGKASYIVRNATVGLLEMLIHIKKVVCKSWLIKKSKENFMNIQTEFL